MIFANNIKRRFHRSCIIIAFFAMFFLVGCDSAKLTTRAYPLGRYPKAAEVIVIEIATDELRKHPHAEVKRPNRMLAKTVDEHIVVKTTPEGHRQIKASLKDLEGQPTAPRED